MEITDSEREAVYKTIFNRRDVRGEFKADPIPDEVLKRVLTDAHHAPSVGFMQPWDFIVVRDGEVKRKIKAGFEIAHKEAVGMFEGERRETTGRSNWRGLLRRLLAYASPATDPELDRSL